MPDNKEQDSYIKPPVKMLTRDLTEKYVKEIVKEAAKRVLKDKVDAEKLDQAWNSTSEQDKGKYLDELEKKLTDKIQNVSTNEQDILREVSDILKNDFDLTKIQNLSQKPSNISTHADCKIKEGDNGQSLWERMLRSYWTKGFLGLILVAVVIYLAIHVIFPAQLSLNTHNLDFGIIGEGTPSPLSFAINNQGKVPLTWNVDTDQPWIAVSPSSGTDAGVVQVAIIKGSLQPGDQQGIINVRSKAGDQQVKVSLHVQKPSEPAVNPISLDFVKIGQTQPLSKVLSISNSGEIPLRWTASADSSWIALRGNKGTNNVSIGVDIIGEQDPGKYNGAITIQSNARSMYVPISLEIKRPPKLTVFPNPLVFNFVELYGRNVSPPEPQSMTIRNDGGDVLNWTIYNDPWITIDPPSGSLSPSAEMVVKVGIKPDLEPKNYPDSLSISSNGGEAKGTVELKKTEIRGTPATAVFPEVPNATADNATASKATAFRRAASIAMYVLPRALNTTAIRPAVAIATNATASTPTSQPVSRIA